MELKNATAGEWLERQYLLWMIEIGERRTIKDFANYLGSSQSYISMVMRNDRQPSRKQAMKWCQTLGNYELLDILGYARLIDSSFLELRHIYDSIPQSKREELIQAVHEWSKEQGYLVEVEPYAESDSNSQDRS